MWPDFDKPICGSVVEASDLNNVQWPLTFRFGEFRTDKSCQGGARGD